MARHSGLKPLCACGCAQRVKGWDNRWATPQCVPKSVRSESGRRGRKTFAYRRRALLFKAELDRLTARGRTVTRESLAEAFFSVYRRGYMNGFCAKRGGWQPTISDSDAEDAA